MLPNPLIREQLSKVTSASALPSLQFLEKNFRLPTICIRNSEIPMDLHLIKRALLNWEIT
jgi:hypothetical protein